jgi:hypothetical protein
MNDAQKERIAHLQAHEHRSPAEDTERLQLLNQLAYMNETHDPIHARVALLESLQEPTPAESDELWYKKNLLDHTMRCALGSALEESVIYGKSMTPKQGGVITPFHRTMSSKEWEEEQRLCVGARIGDIIILKSLAPSETVWVTYALRRIEGRFRWTKYIVYHSPKESCVEVMNSLVARYDPPELFHARLRAAGFPPQPAMAALPALPAK